ncbi:MAG TPA: hypothetical protein VNI20_05875 [Fimbriimonadaceae bacterium]|nr:hypothetical protein [Fimbriimonadaceae bacterium]
MVCLRGGEPPGGTTGDKMKTILAIIALTFTMFLAGCPSKGTDNQTSTAPDNGGTGTNQAQTDK